MKRNSKFDTVLFSEQYYDCFDEELMKYQFSCVAEMNQYNQIPAGEEYMAEKIMKLKEIFGSIGENGYIEPPVHANFGGKNVFIGDNFYANFNLVLVDDGKITIGNNVMIGPNVTIITAEHSTNAEERKKKENQKNRPVTIGDDVWIGASVTILPGVKIGNRSVIGAGALVNKDVPDDVLVVGVPAKVIKKLK